MFLLYPFVIVNAYLLNVFHNTPLDGLIGKFFLTRALCGKHHRKGFIMNK